MWILWACVAWEARVLLLLKPQAMRMPPLCRRAWQTHDMEHPREKDKMKNDRNS